MKKYRPDMHISRQESIPAFLMLVTSCRLGAVCAAHNVPFKLGVSPVTQQLFVMLFDYMAKTLKLLNHCIAADYPVRVVLYRVVDLLSIEVRSHSSSLSSDELLWLLMLPINQFLLVDSTLWRSHCRGFLALVKKYGGVDAVIKSSDDPPPTAGLQYVFM